MSIIQTFARDESVNELLDGLEDDLTEAWKATQSGSVQDAQDIREALWHDVQAVRRFRARLHAAAAAEENEINRQDKWAGD